MTSREMFEDQFRRTYNWDCAGMKTDEIPGSDNPNYLLGEAQRAYYMFTAGLHSRDELLREVEESLSNIISYCRTLGEVDSGFHRVAELLEPAKHKLQTVLQEG